MASKAVPVSSQLGFVSSWQGYPGRRQGIVVTVEGRRLASQKPMESEAITPAFARRERASCGVGRCPTSSTSFGTEVGPYGPNQPAAN